MKLTVLEENKQTELHWLILYKTDSSLTSDGDIGPAHALTVNDDSTGLWVIWGISINDLLMSGDQGCPITGGAVLSSDLIKGT